MPYSVIYVKTLYTWAWAYKCCFCLVYLGKVMQVLFLSCIHGQGHANPAFVLHTWARSCKSCFAWPRPAFKGRSCRAFNVGIFSNAVWSDFCRLTCTNYYLLIRVQPTSREGYFHLHHTILGGLKTQRRLVVVPENATLTCITLYFIDYC